MEGWRSGASHRGLSPHCYDCWRGIKETVFCIRGNDQKHTERPISRGQRQLIDVDLYLPRVLLGSASVFCGGVVEG